MTEEHDRARRSRAVLTASARTTPTSPGSSGSTPTPKTWPEPCSRVTARSGGGNALTQQRNGAATWLLLTRQGLAQATEDLKSCPGVRGVSARDGVIYIQPAGPIARETFKRGTAGGYGGVQVVVERARERKSIRKGVRYDKPAVRVVAPEAELLGVRKVGLDPLEHVLPLELLRNRGRSKVGGRMEHAACTSYCRSGWGTLSAVLRCHTLGRCFLHDASLTDKVDS